MWFVEMTPRRNASSDTGKTLGQIALCIHLHSACDHSQTKKVKNSPHRVPTPKQECHSEIVFWDHPHVMKRVEVRRTSTISMRFTEHLDLLVYDFAGSLRDFKASRVRRMLFAINLFMSPHRRVLLFRKECFLPSQKRSCLVVRVQSVCIVVGLRTESLVFVMMTWHRIFWSPTADAAAR